MKLLPTVSLALNLLILGASAPVSCADDGDSPQTGRTVKKATLKPAAAANSFDFETDQIQGTLRLDGEYHGVSRLVDRRTGRQVIDARYSALNLFKLHSVNHYMGQPRTMPRTISVSDTAAEVTWAATESHQGEITAKYEVIEPNAIDVTITVRSNGTYPGYEVFMSSYFDKVLRPHVYLRKRQPMAEPELVVPMVNDLFRETLPVFPRDALAARRCLDGRWDRDESGTPTVQNVPLRRYGHCVAFMTDPENAIGVVLMSHPRHCYAISSRYHADKDTDRLTSYSAFDMSLFGDDLVAGDQRTVKARLVLTPLDTNLSQPLDLYRKFLAESRP